MQPDLSHTENGRERTRCHRKGTVLVTGPYRQLEQDEKQDIDEVWSGQLKPTALTLV